MGDNGETAIFYVDGERYVFHDHEVDVVMSVAKAAETVDDAWVATAWLGEAWGRRV